MDDSMLIISSWEWGWGKGFKNIFFKFLRFHKRLHGPALLPAFCLFPSPQLCSVFTYSCSLYLQPPLKHTVTSAWTEDELGLHWTLLLQQTIQPVFITLNQCPVLLIFDVFSSLPTPASQLSFKWKVILQKCHLHYTSFRSFNSHKSLPCKEH